MSHDTNVLVQPSLKLDYSLTRVNSSLAVEKGLAEAEWYQCPVPRETLRKLLERKDGPAIRDILLWFALILGSGYLTYALWPTWWAVLPYVIYSALYASTLDSRWHEAGHDDETTYIPESQFPKIYLTARISLLIYFGIVALALATRSLLPLLLIGLPNLCGSWLMIVYGFTQHARLAETVLDHRLNCRTVYMNPVHRYLYWNMNYHLEHHMFPLVPCHALSKLHEAVKGDCPVPYPGLLAAWREIIPAILRQVKGPSLSRQAPASHIPGPTERLRLRFRS